MTIWMRNVESWWLSHLFLVTWTYGRYLAEVVEDARQNFASSSSHQLAPLPPLPLAPLSRSASQTRTNRSSRLPRKLLAASQIFTDDTADLTTTSNTTTTDDAAPSEGGTQLPPIAQVRTPPRPRRATVSGQSPQPIFSHIPLEFSSELKTGSPSKRREKSKSHGNLFQQHIAPISYLEAELRKGK